jgi:chromosome segregation ATPase
LTSKSRLLRDRDRVISSLKAEIRERDQRFRELRQSADELETSNAELVALREASGVHRQLDKQAGEIAAGNARVREIERQQQRTEAYADQLRRRLDDALEDRDQARRESDSFAIDAKQAARKIENLAADLDRSKSAEQAGLDKLTKAQRAHEQEVRLLRFELGEATDTLSERENLSEQLAADLLDSRGYRDELERVLSETADRSQTYIEDLERQVQKLENTVEDNERKLDAKSEAITCLLAELSRKSHEVDSIEEMEDVIQEIDDRISERIDDRPAGSEDKTNAERVTRLLIGRIDDQELRFPLFKDRLTIGRAGNNDIQLKGQHISRRHAVVLNEGNTTRVIDWGSKNGVYVNSERVTEHFLKNGDLVAIGKAEFRYEERPKRDI